jgi:hypothetical protein
VVLLVVVARQGQEVMAVQAVVQDLQRSLLDNVRMVAAVAAAVLVVVVVQVNQAKITYLAVVVVVEALYLAQVVQAHFIQI